MKPLRDNSEHQFLLENLGLVRGEWVPYPGDYEKEFCDIALLDGKELGPCWPNAWKFRPMDGDCKGVAITEDRIKSIRYYREADVESDALRLRKRVMRASDVSFLAR